MNVLTRQLIRASLPAQRAYYRRRLGRTVLEEVDGLSLVVLPDVFNGVIFRTGLFLARTLVSSLTTEGGRRTTDNHPTPSVLDMGTGSGIGAMFAARAGCRVTAVDINPEAVRCTRINALVNHLEERLEVLEGDLFAPVTGRRFDVVMFNPPFFRGAPKSLLDYAWRAETVLERFACRLPDALTPSGYALVAFAIDGDEEGLLQAFSEAGLVHRVMAQRDFVPEVVTVYRVEPAR